MIFAIIADHYLIFAILFMQLRGKAGPGLGQDRCHPVKIFESQVVIEPGCFVVWWISARRPYPDRLPPNFFALAIAIKTFRWKIS
jgi:hypothetical protein